MSSTNIDGLFKIIDKAIEEKKDFLYDIKSLLAVINKDKDGSYFICSENEAMIQYLVDKYFGK